MTSAWRAYGTADSEVTVQELDNSDGRYDWPDAELTEGIAQVVIHTYGDHPSGAFIEVVGNSSEAVTRRCTTAVKAWNNGMHSAVWS